MPLTYVVRGDLEGGASPCADWDAVRGYKAGLPRAGRALIARDFAFRGILPANERSEFRES